LDFKENLFQQIKPQRLFLMIFSGSGNPSAKLLPVLKYLLASGVEKFLIIDGFSGRIHILIPSHLWLLLPAVERELTCI